MTLPPWEYLWRPFSATLFPDLYFPTLAASLVLLVLLVILYNVRTRALHRHRLYTDMWEWLLWTGLITFMLIVIAVTFLFDFAVVLAIEAAGLGTLLWVRFRHYPPLFAAYEAQLARLRYQNRQKASRPEATIRSRGSRRRRR
ncbi:MAG: hypothetical protein HY264_03300 [Chloroflexi bacterium]|nr:hypothetical protein [Chloroflexota bacterium]